MNTKIIAKNTVFLYCRMFLVMGVTLYTSRIVLQELGISDYGIYSVVGGFIALFRFFDASMATAAQRYFSFYIGKNDPLNLKATFSATLTVIIGIALVVLIFAETGGLWYINHKLSIPPGRIVAVNYVYQFSIASAIVGIFQVPYNALIIARERMGIYAYVSIAEAILNLSIVYVLKIIGFDKLIVYATLVFFVTLIIRIFYQIFCRRYYKECKYTFKWNKAYYRELISYSGWNMFGNIAFLARGQGVNMVLNLFFGTMINAAYGITSQVQSAVTSFINNFQLAANPQIVKLYAQDAVLEMQNLIMRISKFSFYLSLLLVAPLFFNIDFILSIWLVKVPLYTGMLIQIALLCALVDSISGPLMTGIQATGKIKIYQMVVGILVFLNLPICYFIFKLNLYKGPEIVFFIWLLISALSLIFRIYFLRKTQNFDLKLFAKHTLFRIGIISCMVYFLGTLIQSCITVDSFFTLIIQSLVICGFIILMILTVGLAKDEKKLCFRMIGRMIGNK